VLVVDDNATQRAVLVQQLSSWRMDAVQGATPVEALEQMRAAASEGAPFAIALIDSEMPEMNGIALARQIAADPRMATTRVVLLSLVGQSWSARDLKQAGVHGQLNKPVKLSRLSDAISAALASSASAGAGEGGVTTRAEAAAEWRRPTAA
jgi:CheY-like chemotaxis protein